MRIDRIPAFKDNYIWLIAEGRDAIVVDPGDAAVVEQRLQNDSLTLREIWITHHHPDHVGGVRHLTQTYPEVLIRAPHTSPLSGLLVRHQDNESFRFPGAGREQVSVWFIPGHTADHIAYLLDTHDGLALFCGDTLFGAGCGRLLGGTAEQLYASLQRLSTLPDSTRVYCAHEYTESNLRFACHVDPDNPALQARSSSVHQQRVKGLPTVPFTLAEERQTNPFLRTEAPAVCQAVLREFVKDVAYPHEIFKYLRAWKDTF